MTFRLSSSGSGALLKNCASFVVPVGPPSALAPLSETTMIERVVQLALLVAGSRAAGRGGGRCGEEAGEDLHHRGCTAAARRRGQRRPSPARPGRAGTAPRRPARCPAPSAGRTPLPVGVPAVVELARVPVGPLLRHMVRRVRRAGAEVQVERLVRVDLLGVGDELDRLVDQVLGQVVALLRRARRLDLVVVVDQVGIPLARVAAEEPVEALEAAPQRPAVVRPGRRLLVARRQVPLADHVGVVAVLEQHLRQHPVLERDDAVVARVTRSRAR